ncbi:nickel pincer cofactor biosynthesis protein LarC [Candidatus Saganbacteria bacterium]|nr:nickel pincer cofactor biosynthesis protein LarC [Candidatus Saganbacteria bacterium]
MKTAYFDCASGISGNMILGSLVNAGVPIEHLKKELAKLRITHYSLLVTRKTNNRINATHIEVKTIKEKNHRSLKDINKIIDNSHLSKKIKVLSKKIFYNLAKAEAKVHKCGINEIHFHEVGAIDAIIDIVGSVTCLAFLGIEEVFCSPINVGSGTTKCAHGTIPIPGPATVELLKGIPIYDSGIKKELATPTGAAIIATLAKSFGPLPRIEVEKTGFGAGGYDLKVQPNFLRVIIGEKELETKKDMVLMIETNIDDIAPKLFDNTITSLLKAGAYDAYFEDIRMKKERAAVKLTVLCPIELEDIILKTIFETTTSFGVRTFLVQREKLGRHFKQINTKYGKAAVKIGTLGKKIMTIAPEYEDYKKLANKHHIPIKKAYREVMRRAIRYLVE